MMSLCLIVQGGGKYLLLQLHTSDIRFYSCDPTCKFNYDEVEEGYRRYIAFVQLEYSHKRGVQRVCKHGMTSASYKKHPDIIRRVLARVPVQLKPVPPCSSLATNDEFDQGSSWLHSLLARQSLADQM